MEKHELMAFSTGAWCDVATRLPMECHSMSCNAMQCNVMQCNDRSMLPLIQCAGVIVLCPFRGRTSMLARMYVNSIQFNCIRFVSMPSSTCCAVLCCRLLERRRLMCTDRIELSSAMLLHAYSIHSHPIGEHGLDAACLVDVGSCYHHIEPFPHARRHANTHHIHPSMHKECIPCSDISINTTVKRKLTNSEKRRPAILMRQMT